MNLGSFNIDTKLYPGLNERTLSYYWQKFLNLPPQHFAESESSKHHRFQANLDQGVPLQYIVQLTPFYQTEFYVDPRVLIPRPETEVLVDLVIKYLERSSRDKAMRPIAEIGVGSGAASISVLAAWKRNCAVDVFLTDISPDALEVAKLNWAQKRYFMNLRDVTVHFSIGDRGQELPNERFELIFSNPPYVLTPERLSLQVSHFEPALALVPCAESQYADWFEHFFKQVFQKLAPKGAFFMEGEYDQWELICRLLRQIGFDQISLHQDLTGRTRFVSAFRPDGH
jgi:release factor glutamine methyltransferase